jgi:membrane-associated protease RseP (regulator of RpoE activity)
MSASRNTFQRIAAAGLAIGALFTASIQAQVSTPAQTTNTTPTNNTATGTAGTPTAGGATATGSITAAAGVPAGSLPATAAPNSIGQMLGLTFANTPGSSLTIGTVADTSPLAGTGLQAGDQILAVNGHPAGSGMSLLNELSRLGSGNQPASITVLTATGTRQTLNVPTAALQQIAQARQPATGARGARSLVGTPGIGSGAAAQNFVTEVLGATIAAIPGGFAITNIADNSPLQGLGLQVGDRIVSINGQAPTSPRDVLNRLVAAAQAQGSAGASLNVLRNGTQLSLTVPTANLQAIAQAKAELTPPLGTVGNQISRSGPPATSANTPASTAQGTDTATTTDTTGIAGVPTNPLVQQSLDARTAANASTSGSVKPAAGFPLQTGAATASATGPQQATISAAGATANTGTGVPTNPLVQQALDTQAANNNPLVEQALATQAANNGADSTGLRTLTKNGVNGQQTTDQQAAVNALSGFQTPAAGTGQPAAGTATDDSLPKTVITPNGPKILMPGQGQAQGRGSAGGVPTQPPNAKGVPGGGKAQGKAGGAPHGNGGARAGGGGGGAPAKAAGS